MILLDPIIKQTFVVSLEQDIERRNHVKQHFSQIGINNYGFVDAVPSDDLTVKKMFLDGRVATYPNCFRCYQVQCECGNNIIIPQQVANWLSFVKTWGKVAKSDGWSLICEDDVLFFDSSIPLLNQFLTEYLPAYEHKPTLIKLAHSGLDTNVSLSHLTSLFSNNRTVMSNVAHVMNSEMAQRLLESFDCIDTTSDIWVHKTMAEVEDINDLTVEPLIATDLSFNKDFARFQSRIHPKGIDAADLERVNQHIKKVDSESSYFSVLESWLGNKESAERCLANNGLYKLRVKQLELIAKLSPEQPKRVYSGQLDHALEKEYGFHNTFENWTSVDRENQPIPWMTYSAIFYLQQLNLSKCQIFEWGSGNSSLFFSKHANHIVSVESNPDWFDYVNQQKQTNQEVLLKSPAEYCTCIKDYEEQFDLIVIDGDIFRRLECAKYAIDKLKVGGIILLDNSDWLPNTTEFLRNNGFTQIDFSGPGPINSYLWCTSIFFKRGISIPSRVTERPGLMRSGIQNVRDSKIPFLSESKGNLIESGFDSAYKYIKQTYLPQNTDVFASQEGEDILLRRLLKWHYHKPGFYVDVGAHDPIRFSNTYHFYLNGWKGINIDPKKGMKSCFDSIRPNDTNLEIGISDKETLLTYYQFKEPAFNTFDVASVEYAKTRTELVDETNIEVWPLAKTLDEYVDPNQQITFYNIDVEGLEINVLKSNDWVKYRPLLIVVEALNDKALLELNNFLVEQRYTRVASTKNSYFFCENKFWEEVK
jgi:GR25 family glycosyltransferase involved in LPS biosynthesis